MEIDESKFGKRKYNRGKRVDGVWVFGGIERDSNPPKCFFVSVPDRSAATLVPIIKRFILPGTTILSDCWKAYSCLRDQGYLHETVNHSVEFVAETGAHINGIESRWNAMKKSLPRYGTNRELYNSYFAEYCILKTILSNTDDKFIAFLRLVGSVYKPADEEALEVVPAVQQATVQQPAVACQSTASTTTTFEVGNFDIGFSLSDDETEFDTSSDLFNWGQ